MQHNKHCAIIGTWFFHRNISDTLLKSNYDAQGQLTVSSSRWVETGTMNGMPFHQHYCVCMGSTFTILFADGTTFYKLEDIHVPERIKHICKNDVYDGVWILQKKTLTLQWNVKGPCKNYSMISTYLKVREN